MGRRVVVFDDYDFIAVAWAKNENGQCKWFKHCSAALVIQQHLASLSSKKLVSQGFR